ncbi:o-succinylbenzoate synthase [Cognatitamlana onchidii]|uniref:o-succinylbenzoate synthase n=1 Tax=Cognatitamlana onchidii TaxID=2562860 RepID=UPI0010A621DD|nr:o-succinylbenzoate synthase [Algibacter onchidii]
MIKASYKRHILHFKQASGTSRGVLKTKETWLLFLEQGNARGIGECGLFRGLSYDDKPHYEDRLNWVCQNIHLGVDVLMSQLHEFPSIQIGVEMSFKSLESHDKFELFPSDFTKKEAPIPINGLIWMGSQDFMQRQIHDKINSGFSCIKMKIGAIDFDAEMELIKAIRKEFTPNDIEIRVDANGAFKPDEALEKLKILSDFDLHSIEQPIKQGQIDDMAELCEKTPLPIALDEELIGVIDVTEKAKLLQTIKPQYIILKPSLVGGFSGSDAWISLAEKEKIGWWVTSALESNIGLNAIAQYTYTKVSNMPQGLGTGGLFTNNFECPLRVAQGQLTYKNNLNWIFNL